MGYLLRYIILPLCALCVMIVFQSCKQTVSEKQEEVKVSECLREKNEGVVDENPEKDGVSLWR